MEVVPITVVRKVVREVVREEISRMLFELLPEVTDEEMEEIEEGLGTPEKYEGENEVEGMEWLGE